MTDPSYLKYGLTHDSYERLLQAQGGACAICCKPERATNKDSKGKVRRLAVDHDHVTGEVRGLLCMACNTALGVYENLKPRIEAYLRSELGPLSMYDQAPGVTGPGQPAPAAGAA